MKDPWVMMGDGGFTTSMRWVKDTFIINWRNSKKKFFFFVVKERERRKKNWEWQKLLFKHKMWGGWWVRGWLHTESWLHDSRFLIFYPHLLFSRRRGRKEELGMIITIPFLPYREKTKIFKNKNQTKINILAKKPDTSHKSSFTLFFFWLDN